MIFSPVLLDTSKIIAFSPLFLANPFLSLNVSLISAISPKVTTEDSFDWIGSFKISSKSSNKPGTRILKLPELLLSVPAGTKMLLLSRDIKTLSAVNP